MQIPRASDKAKDAFRALIPAAPGIEIKAMFGNLGASVNGNMFAGIFGTAIGVRIVDDADRAALAAVEGTGVFGPAERPMVSYIALPADWTRTPELAITWIERALTQVGALKAKTPKPKAPKM
jgi:TfoX/Sxy family transcriptional regulator of competence genes